MYQLDVILKADVVPQWTILCLFTARNTPPLVIQPFTYDALPRSVRKKICSWYWYLMYMYRITEQTVWPFRIKTENMSKVGFPKRERMHRSQRPCQITWRGISTLSFYTPKLPLNRVFGLLSLQRMLQMMFLLVLTWQVSGIFGAGWSYYERCSDADFLTRPTQQHSLSLKTLL